MGDKNCGHGCIMHHMIHCMISAHATGRLLVIDSTQWVYRARWEDVWKPVTEKCKDLNLLDLKGDVMYVRVIDFLDPKPAYLPPAIPQEYSER